MKILRKIEKTIDWYKFFLGHLFKNKADYYIIGTPLHGNLGDHAIVISELNLLKEIMPNKTFMEIPSIYASHNTRLLRLIVKGDCVFINGGGFIGSLWPNEDKMFLKVLRNFSKKKIIVFPQTVYYDNNEYGNSLMMKHKKISAKCKNLCIMTREKSSYRIASQVFGKAQIVLTPDIVMNLNCKSNTADRKQVLLCLRKDKEKRLNEKETKIIEDSIIQKFGSTTIKHTDTVVRSNISGANRVNEVYQKLDEFSKSQLVITDRLHGMIFSYITHTPCIAFNNINRKVEGVYQWIKDKQYVTVIDDINQLSDAINSVVSCNTDNNDFFTDEFDKMKVMIRNYIC